MPPRGTKSLGINEKDYTEEEIGPDDSRRNWVSKNPYSARNRNPEVTANRSHPDFDHLNILLPVFESSDLVPLQPPDFTLLAPDSEAQYIDCIRNKLRLTKEYILKQNDLNLDPDRPGVHKDATAVLLTEPPIKIDLNAQQCVRLLLEGNVRLRELVKDKGHDDKEAKDAAAQYWELWTSLRASLAWQTPGSSEKEKLDRVDRVMSEVLEKLVEPTGGE